MVRLGDVLSGHSSQCGLCNGNVESCDVVAKCCDGMVKYSLVRCGMVEV